MINVTSCDKKKSYDVLSVMIAFDNVILEHTIYTIFEIYTLVAPLSLLQSNEVDLMAHKTVEALFISFCKQYKQSIKC